MVEPSTSSGSWRVTDKNDAAVKVFIGLTLTDHFFSELSYENLGTATLERSNPDINQPQEVDYSALSASLGYWLYKNNAPWNFYAKVGATALNTDTGQHVDQDYDYQLSLGGGVQWHFTEDWFVRFELDSYDKDAKVVGLRLGRYWGSAKQTQVYNGPDQDSDGVGDVKDKCPDTARRTAVASNGCPVLEKINLNVQFEPWSSNIKDKYKAALSQIAGKIKAYGNVNVIIEGHTDSKGSVGDNQTLSESRASAVSLFLEQQSGLKSKQFSVVGYGELNPIASNNTDAGRLKNRRAVIVISQRHSQ